MKNRFHAPYRTFLEFLNEMTALAFRMISYLKNCLTPLSLETALPFKPDLYNPALENGQISFTASGDSGSKPTIRVGRRRRAEVPASGRERAEAPERERESGGFQQSGYGGSGGGGMGGSIPSAGTGGGGLPVGGSKPGLMIILLLLALCVFGGMQLMGGGSAPEIVSEQPSQPMAPTEPYAILPVNTPTRAAKPTTAPLSSQVKPPNQSAGSEQKWLVMLYQDADDKILEQDIYVDLNEAEKVGSDENLTIVAQIDRYRGGFQGDGDWVTAKRFYVTPDNDLSQVASQQVADLGEINMADANTLIDFVTWAVETYPSDRYVLVLSDHGMGWPGGWSDAQPAGRGDPSIPLASRLGDNIYLNELDAALEEIRSQTGIEKFDIVGMDACLMGQLEVFSALQPHARYAVASEEVEPALGWAYTSFLSTLKENPGIDPAEVSRLIVDSYITKDQRIVDEQARSEMLRQSGSMGGIFGVYGSVSSEALARQMGQDGTLSAVDLEQLPAVMDAYNDFAYVLQNDSQPLVAKARAYAQSFTSIFGSQVPASYIDLGNFAQLLRQNTKEQATAESADRLLSAMGRAIIAEKHGPKKPGATGMAIYFPNGQVYQTAEAGARSYTAIASRFANESLWDDFLSFHYTGRIFTPQEKRAVVPSSSTPVRAPGSGEIQLSEVRRSSSSTSINNPVVLDVDVSGQNISYAYLFVGFFDQGSNSIYIADMDFLESPDTRQVGGVYYPGWGDYEDFTLEFEWEPVVFAIDDGHQRIPALFQPRDYGRTYEDAIYTVDGIYTFADSGETRRARLIFSNGALRQVVGFSGEDQTGAAREIVPTRGDQFTIIESWLDLDESGNAVKTAEQMGDTLTFGANNFKYVELDAAAGSYVVGFVVKDFEGNSKESFTQIQVR